MMSEPIRIKTFRSKTLQEAIQKVREEFGPEASILETKAARFGIFGRSRIEVTASSMTHEVDETAVEIDEATNGKIPTDPETESSELPADIAPNNAVPDSTVSSHSVVGSFDAPDHCKHGSVHSQLVKELVDAGIDREIVGQWVDAIRDTVDPNGTKDIWSLRSVVRGWIRDLVRAAPRFPLDDMSQAVIVLVGPPGTGKTTTLAKIAANLSMEHGTSVGVLSADSLRLGSNYLLQNYADVLGWSFEVAESFDQIGQCLKCLAHCRVVLVDTRGCSPEDSNAIGELQQLLEMVRPTETHLVTSSTCNTRSFLRYERAFDVLEPNRLILTRLDEAGGLGPFFSCLQCSELPVSYLTNGQNIPADLIQATGTRLAQQIMSSID